MDNNFKYKNGGFPPLKYCAPVVQKNGKKERLYVHPVSSALIHNNIIKKENIFNIDDIDDELYKIDSIN